MNQYTGGLQWEHEQSAQYVSIPFCKCTIDNNEIEFKTKLISKCFKLKREEIISIKRVKILFSESYVFKHSSNKIPEKLVFSVIPKFFKSPHEDLKSLYGDFLNK